MEHGGGASRSTDPAAGTSSATDVSLREYIHVQIDGLETHMNSQMQSLKELVQSWRHDDQKAIQTAHQASQALAEKHNDLIRQQERKDATYATKAEISRIEAWQSKITGGVIILGFIGIANLTKLWFG
jgi:hypothetical protein